MSFLNNDFVKKAEEQYGTQAEELAEGEAEKYVPKEVADEAIGAVGDRLGIARPTPPEAPAPPAPPEAPKP